MLLEQLEIKLCLRCEWIIDVGIEIYGNQSAGIMESTRG